MHACMREWAGLERPCSALRIPSADWPRLACPPSQIAADNAVFGQTGPKVGSFDAGYGSTQMVRLVGQKKAREMWFLARMYDAQEAMAMGLVNTVRRVQSVVQRHLAASGLIIG